MNAPSESLSDAQVISRLKRHFKQALKSARVSKRCLFLELFSGCEVLSKFLRGDGYAVLAFDINKGAEFDLLRPCVQEVIAGWIRGGCVLGV